MTVDWHDPWYQLRRDLPEPAGRAARVELAGVPVVVGVVETREDVIDAQWMDDREITLALTDDVTGDAFSQLLTAFDEHAMGLTATPPDAGIGPGVTATFSLPSRDVDRARRARGAGFLPASVLAVADLHRTSAAGSLAPVPSAHRVRDAGPADAAAVSALWSEQADFEAAVGTLRTSPAIRAAIRDKAAACIDGPSTVLVAEDPAGSGELLGALVADSVADSTWAAAQLTLAPSSYVTMASTTTATRSRGIGAALVDELHRRQLATALAASTLHYSAFNPLSVPFWSQRGYRPLVTIYERRLAER